MYSYRGCVSYEPRGRRNNYKTTTDRSNVPNPLPILPSSLPLPFSTLAIVSLGRSRSKSERRKVSMIVSFKCLERACRSILRETDKSNSPRHERACPFDDVTMENAIFPPPPVTSRSRQRGDWRQTGRKEGKREKEGRKSGRKHDGQIGDARSREFPEGVFQFNVR